MGLANTGLFSLKAEIITWIRVVRSQRLWRGGEGRGGSRDRAVHRQHSVRTAEAR